MKNPVGSRRKRRVIAAGVDRERSDVGVLRINVGVGVMGRISNNFVDTVGLAGV